MERTPLTSGVSTCSIFAYSGDVVAFKMGGRQGGPSRTYLFRVKNTLQLRHFQEITPGEHAEGVMDLSPGWSEAEPWVLKLVCRPL
jgi:hypothetical protein